MPKEICSIEPWNGDVMAPLPFGRWRVKVVYPERSTPEKPHQRGDASLLRKSYPAGRRKAFCISCDGALLGEERFIRLLKTYRLRASFYTDAAGLEDRLQRLSQKDRQEVLDRHEIALRAPADLEQLSYGEMLQWMGAEKQKLAHISGKDICGIAVPSEQASARVKQCAQALGFQYIRTAKQSMCLTPGEDYYNWTLCIHAGEPDFAAFVDNFLASGEELGMCQVMVDIQDLETKKGFETIRSVFAKVERDLVTAYLTNMQVVAYLQKMRQVVVTQTQLSNPTDTMLWFEYNGYCGCLDPGGSSYFL